MQHASPIMFHSDVYFYWMMLIIATTDLNSIRQHQAEGWKFFDTARGPHKSIHGPRRETNLPADDPTEQKPIESIPCSSMKSLAPRVQYGLSYFGMASLRKQRIWTISVVVKHHFHCCRLTIDWSPIDVMCQTASSLNLSLKNSEGQWPVVKPPLLPVILPRTIIILSYNR